MNPQELIEREKAEAAKSQCKEELMSVLMKYGTSSFADKLTTIAVLTKHLLK